MAKFTPIALADLGANLDAALDAAGVDGKHVPMGPRMLAAAVRVTVNTADLRLYRYDEELAAWVPSEKAAATYAVGIHEIRWTTAEIGGNYALVKTAGTGTVEYVWRSGRIA